MSFVSLAMGLALAAAKPALEVITLKSGAMIKGEVLKERTDMLVVEIGVDVIKIPLKDIRTRGDAATATAATAAAGTPSFGESGDLYATADLPVQPVKDLVNQFGEAVVLVKTPSGLGSGFIIDNQGHCI